jgi:hypothetical protein
LRKDPEWKSLFELRAATPRAILILPRPHAMDAKSRLPRARNDYPTHRREEAMDDLQEPKAMVANRLADLEASVRGQLITRDDKDAFAAARFWGWNRDLNVRANPLGFVVVSGVRDIVTTVNYCPGKGRPFALRDG